MSDRPHNRMSKLISEEAAEWLVCLRAGMSNGERLEYVRWLKQSPAHVRAMLELASLEGLLRRSDLDDIPPTQGQSGPRQHDSTVVELIPRHAREESPSEERRQSPWRHWKFAASSCLSRVGFAGRALSKLVGICT